LNVVTTLCTQRLTLAPFRLEDARELFEIRGDAEAMAHWDWPSDENAEQTCAVAKSLLADVDAGAAIFWTVRLVIGSRFAGLCDLSELDEPGAADLGFMFARRYWGHGYAREAAAAILQAAPGLGVRIVRARIHEDNARSARLLASLGFRRCEVLSDFTIRPGVTRTCVKFERMVYGT